HPKIQDTREPKADEDDEGAVRSEGSGPQSWAIASPVTAASGDLRRPAARLKKPSGKTAKTPSAKEKTAIKAAFHSSDRPIQANHPP
ncbi:hypothetical protein, partial [Achromobacter animicus]|uniref:hypothetical protein n=1 Tax=Achromobacter animicus TaxID=1389935 RepID=UPI0028B0325D